ncbi:MAG: hypothetical protein GTN40_00090 [Candidatus Aenigmarchaeota archaeon]|nr:hypothetical protein [Candidatus Aenigmarchaeota archaeon]
MIKFFKEKFNRFIDKDQSYAIYDLITKIDSPDVSVVLGRANNHYEITKNTKSDRIYYILSGTLIINKQRIEKGEVVYIPKDTEYQFEGTFETLVINSPAFDPKYDITKISERKK